MFRLNYTGPQDDQLGRVLGPNSLNERLQVVEQSYDPNTNRTTLGLKVYIKDAHE